MHARELELCDLGTCSFVMAVLAVCRHEVHRTAGDPSHWECTISREAAVPQPSQTPLRAAEYKTNTARV